MASIIEIQTDLQKLTNRKITYTDIGNILGTGRANISTRAKNNSQVTPKEISLLENAYNVSLSDIKHIKQYKCSDTDSVTLDYYPDIFGSCGNGIFELSQEKEQIIVPKKAFFEKFSPNKTYSVINAYGNSMQPLIFDKDKLIVEHWDGEQIIDNKPYIFCYKDEIFIKRLAKNVDQLMIISENKDYDIRKLTGNQLKDVNIIGQIVGLMRDLR